MNWGLPQQAQLKLGIGEHKSERELSSFMGDHVRQLELESPLNQSKPLKT